MTRDVSPVGVPVCYRHPGRETYVRCTRCDRPICPDCMRDAAVGHQCPECVTEGRRTQRQPRTAFGASALGQRGYVTITFVAINILMLLLSVASAKNSGAEARESATSACKVPDDERVKDTVLAAIGELEKAAKKAEETAEKAQKAVDSAAQGDAAEAKKNAGAAQSSQQATASAAGSASASAKQSQQTAAQAAGRKEPPKEEKGGEGKGAAGATGAGQPRKPAGAAETAAAGAPQAAPSAGQAPAPGAAQAAA